MASEPSEARIQAALTVQGILQEAGTLDLTPEDWTERLEFALEAAREEGRREVMHAIMEERDSGQVAKSSDWRAGINRALAVAGAIPPPSPPPGEGGGG